MIYKIIAVTVAVIGGLGTFLPAAAMWAVIDQARPGDWRVPAIARLFITAVAGLSLLLIYLKGM